MTVVDAQIVGEATTALALPDDVAVLDAAADPGVYLVTALGNAKAWLEQVAPDDLPRIVEEKSRAAAIEKYAATKEHGKDAALLAAEIVRRCERAIGELIRQGQAEGTIRRPSKTLGAATGHHDEMSKVNPRAYFRSDSERSQTYAMTDGVSAEEFEAGLAEAKAEKNLSRVNVVRKVQKVAGKSTVVGDLDRLRDLAAEGHTSKQIANLLGVSPAYVRQLARDHDIALADAVIGKARNLNHNRIVSETTHALEGLAASVDLVDLDAIDATQARDWATSIGQSLRLLNRFHKQLKEMAQ